MNYKQEYKVSNLKPVLQGCDDVERMIEENARARIISQIVGAPDGYVARDFAASFHSSTRGSKPAQFTTSHKICPDVRQQMTIPTYPTLVHQSLRWNPYVEMSSAENSQTNLIPEERQKYNCWCKSCSVKTCPSRVTSSGTLKPAIFKDNIMTFSDQFTMTPRLNDACCGVCTPIPAIPRVSDVCVSSDEGMRDTETVTHLPTMYTNKSCAPIPILKRSEFDQTACTYGYCDHTTGHVPVGIRQEAVRDTDMSEDYCEPIKPKSLKNFMKFRNKEVDQPHCMPEYGRKIIYNEGICDTVANNCPIQPNRVPPPINVIRESSKVAIFNRNRCYIENEDGIPYAYRSKSRYHHSCKNPNMRPSYYQSDADEVRHLVGSPKMVRKTFASRGMRNVMTPSICLPRKVLTSEADIESYIDKGRSFIETSGRRKNNRK